MLKKQKERVKKRIVATMRIAVAVLIVLGVIYMAVDHQCREQSREKYEPVARYYLERLEEEKSWIAGQQHEMGPIYLYDLGADDEGTIVPYFSCKAAMGLLAGEVTDEHLKRVELYLNWHAEEIVKNNGIVSDYRVVNGVLEPKGEYDSVDAYLALYLSLLATYAECGGALERIAYAEESVKICADVLDNLTVNGLTKVSEETEVCYLMDNLEVLEAYEKIYRLLTSDNSAVATWESGEYLTDFFGQSKDACRQAILLYLWNESEKRFEVGVNKRFECLEFQGMEEFYPYAVCQIHPVACDVSIVDVRLMQNLYEQINANYTWVELESGTSFERPVLAYTAVQLGDLERAEKYMENYHVKYAEIREYPFHTSNAGLAAQTYGKLYEYYNDKANQNLWDILFGQFL